MLSTIAVVMILIFTFFLKVCRILLGGTTLTSEPLVVILCNENFFELLLLYC